jgi:hypothetical protein
MIEQAIVSLLKANATVASLVGPRIHPNRAPQSWNRPYIVYRTEDAHHVMALDGPAGIAEVSMSVISYCQGKTQYGDAKRLTEAIRSLHGFKGMAAGFRILGIFLHNDNDEYVAPQSADEYGVQGCLSDFKIWFNE